LQKHRQPEAPLAKRTVLWIEEKTRSEPRQGAWQLRVGWKVAVGVISYPYIRIHASYRRSADRRWREERARRRGQPIRPLTPIERFVDRVLTVVRWPFRFTFDLVLHLFHHIATHWPRPNDLSGCGPAAEGTAPALASSTLGDPASLPTISVVTPSYGYGHFIEWTIRSVLMQRYPKLELIVMDGGSRDSTVEVIQKYRSELKHAESKKDRGQADAVVRGFKHSTGEIMAYLNSDDMLAPGALEFVAQYFQDHPEVDMVYSHRVIVDDDNKVTGHWILPEHSDWYMQRWDYIPQETCFWRRSIYEKVGGIDRTFKFALDFDLFVRFMRAGARIQRVDRFLGAFRVHNVSKTSSELQEGTVHPEVARVWRKYKVRLARWQEIPAVGIREWIDVKSRQFAVSGKTLPGALAGVGYDFDQAWGGLLNDRDVAASATGN
jgi:glycosyltransferase involved in cell wall biosynthesis